HYDRVGREGPPLHRSQVHRANAATDAISVEHRRQKLPVLVFLYFAFGLIPPHLLIQRVQKLLTSRRARERGAVIQGSTETAEIQQSLWRAIERHAHAIEQIDNPRRSLAHIFDGRLIS